MSDLITRKPDLSDCYRESDDRGERARDVQPVPLDEDPGGDDSAGQQGDRNGIAIVKADLLAHVARLRMVGARCLVQPGVCAACPSAPYFDGTGPGWVTEPTTMP